MYFVITDEKTCGHLHRKLGRAIDCLDKFEKAGFPAQIIKTEEYVSLDWIDHQLCKWSSASSIAKMFETN